MEPSDGSTIGTSNLPPIFHQHRGRKKGVPNNETPDSSSIVDSGYLTISHNTPNYSSSSSGISLTHSGLATSTEISTPERFSGSNHPNNNNSNLNTLLEHHHSVQDAIKLTPVTQNIQSISNFHITTPKDVAGTKRNVAAVLNFEDFESTPKKPRIDVNFCTKHVPSEAVSNTTPRKATKFRPKKQSFRKKLKSAPDLDFYFAANNIENEPSNRQENISPIFDKSATRGSRTPLSSSNSNLLLISTPKSSNHNHSNYGGGYSSKPSSVKKLLTFSDSQFEQLLGVGKKQDLLSFSTIKKTPPCTVTRIGTASTTSSSTKKCLTESFVRASNSSNSTSIIHNEQTNDPDNDNSIRPLSFSTTPSSGVYCDISSEPTSLTFKKINAVTREVLRDRELSRRHLSSRIPLLRQFSICNDSGSDFDNKSPPVPVNNRSNEQIVSTGALFSAKSTTKKEKTESESQGFQDILNISTECQDMEISAICAEDAIANEEKECSSANYNIPSTTDLALNDSIVCDAKSPSPPVALTMPSTSFAGPGGLSSRIPLPRTPKKIKPTSVDHERLEILYPMIRRTPSKYNPFHRRAATKRKYVQDLSSTFKRHCKYYGGNTHLNIIAKLLSYEHLLNRIFRRLEAADLANMCEVSRSWRQAVQSSRWAWNQVRSYLNKCRSLKENERCGEIASVIDVHDAKPDSSATASNDDSYKKIPFNQSNLRIVRKRSIEQNRSPPVSPSKRKFHENQKVVRTLAPNEKLLKCPRCNKSSRIYNALKFDTNHHSTNILNRNMSATSTNKLSHIRSLSQTFHSVSKDTPAPAATPMTSSTPSYYYTASRYQSSQRSQSTIGLSKTTSSSLSLDSNFTLSSSLPSTIPRNSTMLSSRSRFPKSLSCDSAPSLPEEDFAQYAECSGLSCSYRFCLECLCDYHPGAKCKLYEPSSPSKDDGSNDLMQPGVMTNTRSGKSSRRKTLKRLCF